MKHIIRYWKARTRRLLWKLNHFSLNEGYDFRMRFPWVNGTVALLGRFFYLSLAFRSHVGRITIDRR